MADTKITEMVAGTLSAGDLLTFVDDPAGTPVNKKVAYSTLESGLSLTESQISDLGTYIAATATDASGYSFVVDEDNMASDSATKLPTQQSVKAYVDSVVAGLTALEAEDIDTLAEINAIIGDATLVTVEATDASGYGWVIDEDDLVSDSATKVPTQQSVKAYVDANAGGVTDHGALSGLTDDDHTQYLLAAGTRAGTGLQELLGLNLTDSTELTLSSGAVTVTQGYHTVDTESDAATDDLDTITVAGGEGDILILRAESSARTVVLKHGTGNIQCAEGYDLSLDSDYDYAILIRKDGTNWMAFSGARRMPPYLDNGDTLGGANAGDIYYHDGTTVTNLRVGTNGQHLELAAGIPAWVDDTGGSANEVFSYLNGASASNNWLIPPTGGQYVSDTSAVDTGQVYVVPVVLSAAASYDNIGFSVNTGGTATLARVGLYDSSGGFPDTLIDEVEVSMSTGDLTGGITSGTIGPGLFFLAITLNGTATLEAIDKTSVLFSFGRSGIGINAATCRLQVAHAYGAMPSSLSSAIATNGEPILLAIQKV